jgi:hypothetical protein
MATKKTTTARRTTTAKKPARARTTKSKTTSRRARTEAPATKTGAMTVREAGRKGGLIGGKKGGETVKAERGIEFYQTIGRKGGQKVRQLIEAGRAAMQSSGRKTSRR